MSWLLTDEEMSEATNIWPMIGENLKFARAIAQAQLRKVAENLKAGTNSLNFIPFISQKDLQALYKEAGVEE